MLKNSLKLKTLINICLSMFATLFLLSCEPDDPGSSNTRVSPVIVVDGMPSQTQTLIEPQTLQLNASQSAGSNLSYTWLLDNVVVSNSAIYTPVLNAGDYQIMLVISNGAESSNQIYNVSVQSPNAQPDDDLDGVQNSLDQCPNTSGAVVLNGCSQVQLDIISYNSDDDNDGVINGLDYCANTTGLVVSNGCSQAQIDANSNNPDIDGDSVLNEIDQCLNTPANTSVDANGCSQAQLQVIEYNQDNDSDGVINGLDICPDVYGEDTDGCLLGSKYYENLCLECHGDEQGNNETFGGALTYFECADCEDRTTLVHTIEADMPVNNVYACDNNCANKIADYILSEFEGFGVNLTGQQLYEGLCESCHGDGEESVGLNNPQLVPASCVVCDDAQSTITKIVNTMPFNESDKCDLDCATKITDYMRSTFSGYSSIVETPLNNLNAKGDLNFAFVNNQLQISWQARTQTPDLWILERFNEDTSLWDLMQSSNGLTTSFTDTNNSIGLYRVYAITDSIASVPVYGKASATQVITDNGAAWGESDGLFFMHKSVSGNFSAEFTLHARNEPSEWTKIGLMLRDSADAGSKHIAGYYNGNRAIEATTRSITDGETNWIAGGGADLPVRLRMTRTGNTLVFSIKEEGADWVVITSESISINTNAEIGIAFASNYGTFPMIAKISAFTIDNQIINDYTQTNMGNFDDAIVNVDAPVQGDDSQVAINPKVEEQPLARINRFVFSNQLKDISGNQDLDFNLTQDDTSSGFEIGLNSSALSIEKYLTAAENYAQIVAPSVQASMTCEIDDSDCINVFIKELATQYLRVPPSLDQIEILNNVYWLINDQLGQAAAVQGTLETLIQSPAFLYQFESDGANMPAGTSVPVTGLSMAYRLANTLWAGMPDTQLLAAAHRGELSTPAQIKAQAQRMVEDEKAQRGFNLFYRQWLDINELEITQKDVPGIDFDSLAPQMIEAMDHYMSSIVFDDQTPSSFNDLFTAPLVATNDALAPITNIASNSSLMSMQNTGAEFGDQRTGILGQPAMLALLGHAQTTSIVHRGVFVSQQLMCAGFPPPPDNVPQLDSIDTTGKSSREVLDELTGVDGCDECHKLINPVGATFEHFDTIGRARNVDDLGVAVDANADIYSRLTGSVDGTFNGLKELNEYLASLESVKSCFVSQYLTYAIGRVPSTNERSSVNWLMDQLDVNNGNIKQMLVEATQTPVFLYKKTKQVGE